MFTVDKKLNYEMFVVLGILAIIMIYMARQPDPVLSVVKSDNGSVSFTVLTDTEHEFDTLAVNIIINGKMVMQYTGNVANTQVIDINTTVNGHGFVNDNCLDHVIVNVTTLSNGCVNKTATYTTTV
ncbi:MAG: hypothetical protein ACXADY_23075 [Candidatus Hodarchaeales archaeon]|jgi:hypothetical protein